MSDFRRLMRDSDYNGPGSSDYAERWDGVFGPKKNVEFKQFSSSFEIDKPQFDGVLKDIYAAGIADIIRKDAENLYRFLDLPTVPPTRWQRLKWKLSGLWYNVRHFVCCGHEDD